jgi:hypothetical protein
LRPKLALTRTKKAAFALLTVVLVLGIAEIVLRFGTRELGRATIPDDLVQRHVREGSMKYHPVLGWVRSELPNPRLGLNAEGFRYGDVPREKPPGTWRAFTLGDSQTYGAGARSDETYTFVAEQLLRQRLGRGDDLQVINTGTSGYGSLQALRLIEIKLLAWDPDLVIVDCRTYDQSKDGLLPPIGGTRAAMEGLLWNSRLYYTIRFWAERLRPTTGRSMQHRPGEINEGERKLAFGNHENLRDLAQRHGVGLMFVDYPVWDQKRDTVVCQAPPEELPEGVPVVRACLALQESGRAPSELFIDPNHLKAPGNNLFGHTLADAILAAGFLTDR